MSQYNPLALPISQIYYDPSQEKWRSQANCRNTPVDVFFPDKGASKEKIAKARAICNECNVIDDCHDWSIQFSERALVGIWAGMTTIDRRKERRRLGLAKDDTRMDG
jgi:WhiB family redox-sensing transcriptional regulator